MRSQRLYLSAGLTEALLGAWGSSSSPLGLPASCPSALHLLQLLGPGASKAAAKFSAGQSKALLVHPTPSPRAASLSLTQRDPRPEPGAAPARQAPCARRPWAPQPAAASPCRAGGAGAWLGRQRGAHTSAPAPQQPGPGLVATSGFSGAEGYFEVWVMNSASYKKTRIYTYR